MVPPPETGQPGPSKKPRRLPEVIEARCKGCGYCIQFCPKDVLAFSGRFNAKGYYIPVNQLPEKCHGCGMCEMVCPDFAIFLVEDEEAARVAAEQSAAAPDTEANGA